MEQSKLTVSEALAQGYTSAANRNDEWTFLHSITELNSEDFENNTWWLADKEPKTISVTPGQVKDLITDVVAEDESEIGCDHDKWSGEPLDAVDWNKIAEMINAELHKEHYHAITIIQLVP